MCERTFLNRLFVPRLAEAVSTCDSAPAQADALPAAATTGLQLHIATVSVQAQ